MNDDNMNCQLNKQNLKKKKRGTNSFFKKIVNKRIVKNLLVLKKLPY